MAHEGALWPIVTIKFEPHQHNSKITWALMQNWILHGIKNIIRLLLYMVGTVKNTLGRSYAAFLRQFGPS